MDRQLYSYATATWTRLTPQLYADKSGTLLWQYTPSCSCSARGDFYVWIYDYAKRKSFAVWETVTPGACN